MCYRNPSGETYGPFTPDKDPDGIKKLLYLEDMKEWTKETNRMKRDRTKLYALILKYLSDESREVYLPTDPTRSL